MLSRRPRQMRANEKEKQHRNAANGDVPSNIYKSDQSTRCDNILHSAKYTEWFFFLLTPPPLSLSRNRIFPFDITNESKQNPQWFQNQGFVLNFLEFISDFYLLITFKEEDARKKNSTNKHGKSNIFCATTELRFSMAFQMDFLCTECSVSIMLCKHWDSILLLIYKTVK